MAGHLVALSVQAQQPEEEFPKILTLAMALEMLSDQHPKLGLVKADLSSLDAESIALESESAFQSNLLLDGRLVDRLSDPGHDYIDDSRATLTLDKPLNGFWSYQCRASVTKSQASGVCCRI